MDGSRGFRPEAKRVQHTENPSFPKEAYLRNVSVHEHA